MTVSRVNGVKVAFIITELCSSLVVKVELQSVLVRFLYVISIKPVISWMFASFSGKHFFLTMSLICDLRWPVEILHTGGYSDTLLYCTLCYLASPLLFLLPFHLFQINRVALIQCVSCRLPWRLFDPVFQSLPLGQTCFSSVCCTPALEAAAALRQTMGCCARLAPPSSSCRSHFLSVFLSPLYLFSYQFFSQVSSIFVSLSLTRSASLCSHQSSPLSAWTSRKPRGREEARISAQQPSQGEIRETGTSFSLLLLLLTCSICLYCWF